ncbi:hypothetical protein [Cellulomonas gilvus]|uniref:Lanthionine synthetase C family protein n=1 Tax=Cellulomonas gilvus (strain ATCC 13127 / NRRL B-14078) TaxID=593907 RepID=F8A3G8_CELGA|nr:hypothetical protein [Cellulomonas gilvus]AEI10732.1 hypothetical protein Celgi_0206 [Cellulomonas gilvus ATCC 13127]
MGACEAATGGAPPHVVRLAMPDLEAARRWLDAAPHLPAGPVRDVLAHQHDDGSWGVAGHASRRVLTTLWTAGVVADLDELGEVPGESHSLSQAVAAAAGFLGAHATTDRGVFSRNGRDDGVLACYVALAAVCFLRGGRLDLAEPQVDWILRYQDVRVAGRSPRGELPVYVPSLATRYGGCLAATSCVIGVIKAGLALTRWQERVPVRGGARAREVAELLSLVRQALLDRRLMLASDRTILPLGRAGSPSDWLMPTFPLDWRTDLTEVIGVVAGAGGVDRRVQPALDHLTATQIPGAGWPLTRGFWPEGCAAVERRGARRSSRLATTRVLRALAPLAEGRSSAALDARDVSH